VSLPTALTAIIDALLDIDGQCADLDRRFQTDGSGFRFDYGNESFIVSPNQRVALLQEYRRQNRKSTIMILFAGLVGSGLAVGADLLTAREVPLWLTVTFLLGPLLAAGIGHWRDGKRRWDGLVSQMRHYSANAKALAPTPSP
jgi:hypothetical protein